MQNNAVQSSKIGLMLLSLALFCAPPSISAQPAGGKTGAAPRLHVVPPPEARVDINHASFDELMKVPGMTRSWAGRIVRFRPYRTKSDLIDRGVLTGDVYYRIKDFVIAHREKQ